MERGEKGMHNAVSVFLNQQRAQVMKFEAKIKGFESETVSIHKGGVIVLKGVLLRSLCIANIFVVFFVSLIAAGCGEQKEVGCSEMVEWLEQDYEKRSDNLDIALSTLRSGNCFMVEQYMVLIEGDEKNRGPFIKRVRYLESLEENGGYDEWLEGYRDRERKWHKRLDDFNSSAVKKCSNCAMPSWEPDWWEPDWWEAD